MNKLRESDEEAGRIKKASNLMEKEKASADLALKSLQAKYDQLNKNHEATREKMKVRHASSTSEHAAYTGGCTVPWLTQAVHLGFNYRVHKFVSKFYVKVIGSRVVNSHTTIIFPIKNLQN